MRHIVLANICLSVSCFIMRQLLLLRPEAATEAATTAAAGQTALIANYVKGNKKIIKKYHNK